MYHGENAKFDIYREPQTLKGMPVVSTQLIQKDFSDYELVVVFRTEERPELDVYEKFTLKCLYGEQLVEAETRARFVQ